jgi:predicted aspartyl protease
MENLVIVTPKLYNEGALVRAEIYPSERTFLKCKNGEIQQPARHYNMLVDTGSNISALDRPLIEMLQLPLYSEKACVDGAGGLTTLNRFRCVLYIDIFGQKALPLDILEGRFQNSPYDGVIGRDVLQFCTMSYDGPANSFKLSAPNF